MSDIATVLIEKEQLEHSGSLDLGNCGMQSLPDNIEGLNWLEQLSLTNHFFYDHNTHCWMESLSKNAGKPNKISDVRPLHPLKKLKKLSLSLDLTPNEGQFQFNHFEELKSLEHLYIDCNRPLSLKGIGVLANLKSLSLRAPIINRVGQLKKLKKLKYLSLSGNHEINIEDFLENESEDLEEEYLINLLALDLNFKRIENADLLTEFSLLESLELRRNDLDNIRFVKNLINLKFLDLRFNKITDISSLEKCDKIKTLLLTENKIRDIKPLLPLIRKNIPVRYTRYSLGAICISDNPISNPPLTTVVLQGNTSILEYFRNIDKTGEAPLLEAKMILLGEARAGKTSLACRLLGRHLPQEQDRTVGVKIIIGEYLFPDRENRLFKLNIWDFAGHEKYKPLHQFFYTEGAVYVLVAENGNANTDYDDWFQTAELFGGNDSPLIVVLNEFKEDVGSFDSELWRRQFPTLIKGVRNVNLLSKKGFDDLEKDIRYFAESLEHTKVIYPQNWADIRVILERRREENFITLSEYLKICQDNKLPEKESALILSRILHKVGVCLHYEGNELLRQHVILKNEWATDAVYKVLQDSIVGEVKKGFFDWSDLNRIWSETTYNEMRPQLLELMKQFRLAYQLPLREEYVAPTLLPPTPPTDWKMPEAERLTLFLEYDFVPKALLTQFIVLRHTEIANGRTLVWNNGVVIRWDNTIAEIRRFKSRGRDAFQIRSQGSNRKGLLTSILKTFRDLHGEYKGIKVTEVIPCPCEGCHLEKNEQHYFDFENLKNRLERGRQTVECDKSLEEVKLMKLLGDVLIFEHLAVGQPVVMMRDTEIVPEKGIIHDLIANNHIAEALGMLQRERSNNVIISISSQWQQLQQDEMLGVLSHSELTQRRNQILNAMLLLADSGKPGDDFKATVGK